MVSQAAIRIDNLGKRYQIGARERTQTTFRESLCQAAAAPWCRFRRLSGWETDAETFWALRNLSFEVQPGEVVGIIGRNGAGKSTLLKLLSQITEPTTGRIELNGRVASLLEVGTGFHPELTGRENIYLNGAILGMSRAEIKRKFDAIVAFAEIDKFLDTPVKRYSSGMYVRLAFSVAAHLESEILIVDEVLAVGDSSFQKKCLGKMGDIASGGRTVLFVTHNMPMVERLCSRALLLSGGQVVFCGSPRDTVGRYLQSPHGQSTDWIRPAAPPDHPHFLSAYLCDVRGERLSVPTSASQFGAAIEFCVPHPMEDLILGVCVYNQSQQPVFSTSPLDCDFAVPARPGVYRTTVQFPPAIFMPKRYSLQFVMYTPSRLMESWMDALQFDVEDVASLANKIPGGRAGDLQVLCEWSPFHRQD